MRSKIAILFLLVPLLFLPLKAQAQDNDFSTSYDVAYDIGQDGSALVTERISLKNLTSQFYATNYTLTVNSTTISDVQASDSQGSLATTVDRQGLKTAINVKFNQQIVGQGKIQSFTLKFKSNDFAQAVGKTWEVNLPKIPSSGNIDVYNLVLSVPISFGDPTSISPNPKNQNQSFDRLFFSYTKDQIQKSGISANFGSFQVFDFDLKYHLVNSSLFPVLTSVTLPPNTQYQDVIISRLNPLPDNVTVDRDGNYLAWYTLPRRSSQDVSALGSAKLYINPKTKDIPLLFDQQLRDLTKSQKYWDSQNPAIKATLAQIFKDGTPTDNTEKARLIYRYVVDVLKYDTSRANSDNIDRLGALTALNNPNSAVCMEFTDLFIALARSASVPARELDGFAYTQNQNLRPLSLSKDLLHAWPEFYDPKRGWVMVDPTWENTSGGVDYFNKLDLNHLVIGIRGESSQQPVTGDNIKVVVSNADFVGKPQIEVLIDLPEEAVAGLPVTAKIKIINQGNFESNPANLTLTSSKLVVNGDNTVKINSVPPYGNSEHNFTLTSHNFWDSFNDTIQVDVAGQKFVRTIAVRPSFLFRNFVWVITGAVVIFSTAYGSVLVLHIRQRRKYPKK